MRKTTDKDDKEKIEYTDAEENVPEPEVEADQPDQPKRSGGLPEVLVDGELFYCVEGDLLLDIDELEIYQQARAALQSQREAARRVEEAGFREAEINGYGLQISSLVGYGLQTSSLVGIVQNGKVVRWAPGTVLRYCVLRQTFPKDEWYEEVVENMQSATDEWTATCGVTFEYVESADGSESLRPPEVLFPVRYINGGGAFIAAAFFPHEPTPRRRMLIDPSYYSTSFDRVGVLRHELGHILGFRHEHIRSGAPAICPDESTTGTIDLTPYDPQSVMHYFCGGVGSLSLAITALDRTGSQLVYGPPLSNFELLEISATSREVHVP